ncbi:MAG: FtsH protease activity modulator HflK [bacterium]
MKIPYKTVAFGTDIIRIPDFGLIFRRSGFWLIALIILIWLASGVYMIGPDEVGVIRTFGKYTRISTSGLNYRLPWPVESVDRPKITEIKRIEIGFRMDHRTGKFVQVPEESLMLTGSLNIVDMNLIVQYKISDPVRYLFLVRDVPTTVRVATEAVIRQVVGQHTIDEALTTGKGVIQAESVIMLQHILDSYECGVTINQVQLQDVLPPDEVAEAFREVASAKEDKARLINEAQGYANDNVPKARGQGAEMVLQAEAFAAERVKRSQGEAENFLAVMKAYHSAPDVTRKRMLLETMEVVLPGLNKYILQTNQGSDLINVIGPGLVKPDGGTSTKTQGGSR